MKFIADLHIHSHYSRATSRALDFEHLVQWAQLKGVNVVGTGDISHPGWLAEIKEKLEPAEAGLFRLRAPYAEAVQAKLPPACHAPVRFMLAGEISNIYKKKDKTRKVHHVVFMPTLEAVERYQAALEKIGNIRADGRPILGLDSRDLLEIVLETDPQAYLIPAHIWTPWFSVLGSKSGFDTIAACFDDLTPHIFALETGLSSDPPMNWRVSALDGYTLVSNSDAHSPEKLAREANLFDTELSYPAIFAALKGGPGFLGTLEFFPEEGKYHFDGHRKCGIVWDPQTTLAHNGLCPACGKEVTVGVMSRVEMLADREPGHKPAHTFSFHSLIPLPEILGEVYNVGAGAKRVREAYEALLARLGPELTILQEVPLAELETAGGTLLAEAIRRMRCGEVSLAPGYDGEYGVVKLFEPHERASFSHQPTLFITPPPPQQGAEVTATPSPGPLPKGEETASKPRRAEGEGLLNPQQQAAVRVIDTPLILVAGPGAGKTRTLTYRIAALIQEQGATPETILAITFTNKATAEMSQRLAVLLGPAVAGRIVVKTFHAFGAMLLREVGERFSLCSDDDRKILLKRCRPNWSNQEITQALSQISAAKNQLATPDTDDIYHPYEAALQENHLRDLDDLIVHPVRLLGARPDLLQAYQARFRWISVDEYQDINYAQYHWLRLLASPTNNLCVIGDPDQAIYGFRGARREYFFTFEQDFPGATRLHLNQNYRSTQLILNASRQVIIKSTEEYAHLQLWSEMQEDSRLDIYSAPTAKAEAEYVVHQIEQMVGGTSYFSLDSGRVKDDGIPGRTFGDFAVLYRLGAQSRLLAEAFKRSGIPYQTVGQTPLYAHKAVKPILAGLWFMAYPETSFHLEKIFSKPRAAEIASFLRSLEPAQPIARLIEQIYHFAQERHLLPAEEKNHEPIHRLILRAVPYDKRLEEFLEATALYSETDAYDPRAGRVTLMTLHAAKGLEFPVVFIVGCEEDLLPYRRAGQPFDLDEERRLFYVGMTRAQQKLILTHARSRFLFGRRTEAQPSPFLGDIENALKTFQQMARPKPPETKKARVQLKLF
jgi:uncharacterized protein (TIGR00375 family)